MRVTDTQAWSDLRAHAAVLRGRDIRELAHEPADRAEVFGVAAAGIHLDYSRQRVDETAVSLLVSLARQRQVPESVHGMFSGAVMNATEKRAVLHTALRAPDAARIEVDGVDVMPEVAEVRRRMRDFTASVLSGEYVGSTGRRFTDVVNIGIGGSDLGPVMVTEALRAHAVGIRPHFISNVDPTDAFETLSRLDPETTLVLIASKTFTTAETMANATLVRAWLERALPSPASASDHLVALSTAVDKAQALGIPESRVFGFWDWVGGRYSVGSAIGLSVMLTVGVDAFDDFLDGMRLMDEHFRDADPGCNLPMLLGLLGVWNRNFLDIATVAVLPYEQYLHRLPAYLQQLTMESNGKSVTVDGAAVGVQTAPVLWGEPGTNGQHSFHQMIHQGTEPIACDIIAFGRSAHDAGGQHTILLANALAQAQVMAYGRSAEELRAAGVPDDLVAHKVMPGNRPCNIITAPMLTPHALGALVAMYEHAVFTQGVVWGINSFDQWGVEYGKEVATALVPAVTDGSGLDAVDRLTAASIRRLRGQ